MSFIKAGFSAINKFLIVIALAGTFVVGMAGTVYLSLRGEELKVPEIIGKDYLQSEKELEAMGLKIKRRADRFSQEKPNTVLEQLPKAGDTVKSGQMILVVVSKVNPEGTEAPATVKKDETVADDNPDDLQDDKNKKSNKNANVKRPAQTTRDVVSNKANKNTSSNVASSDTDSAAPKNSNSATPTTSGNKNTNPANKVTTPSNTPKPSATKSPAATSGETRTRKVP